MQTEEVFTEHRLTASFMSSLMNQGPLHHRRAVSPTGEEIGVHPGPFPYSPRDSVAMRMDTSLLSGSVCIHRVLLKSKNSDVVPHGRAEPKEAAATPALIGWLEVGQGPGEDSTALQPGPQRHIIHKEPKREGRSTTFWMNQTE